MVEVVVALPGGRVVMKQSGTHRNSISDNQAFRHKRAPPTAAQMDHVTREKGREGGRVWCWMARKTRKEKGGVR